MLRICMVVMLGLSGCAKVSISGINMAQVYWDGVVSDLGARTAYESGCDAEALEYTVIASQASSYGTRIAKQIGVRDCNGATRLYVWTSSGWLLNSVNGAVARDSGH